MSLEHFGNPAQPYQREQQQRRRVEKRKGEGLGRFPIGVVTTGKGGTWEGKYHWPKERGLGLGLDCWENNLRLGKR